MKRLLFFLLLPACLNLSAQPLSGTFEMRYFTRDTKADGETDFKGETEWLSTPGRVNFLNKYADYASSYFKNNEFKNEIVTDRELSELVNSIKPQPLTRIRTTITLDGWKSYGYKKGQEQVSSENIESWTKLQGNSVVGGTLNMEGNSFTRQIDSLNWRFKFECKIKITGNNIFSISFSGNKGHLLSFELNQGNIKYGTGKNLKNSAIENSEWLSLLIEGDMTGKRFNLNANGNILAYYIPMINSSASEITSVTFTSKGKTALDDIVLYNYIPTTNINRPYNTEIALDEDFEIKSDIRGWQSENFSDNNWMVVSLPSAHGGIREKEEDYYLRKTVNIGDFEQATLMIEAIDPGGEVWINNEVAAVVTNRYPVELDVTKFLKENQENLVAVKVNNYQSRYPSPHAPTDPYTGWFLGRSSLVLSSKCMIKEVLVSTDKIDGQAVQNHKINIHYNSSGHLDGRIEINYYPWFPEEGGKAASFSQDINIRPRVMNEFTFDCPVPSPKLWSCESPNLYKVEVILTDRNGKPVDDFVTTTGIRTVEQKNGNVYLNGQVEMLNGAQIMGFRTPLETMAKYVRCARLETVAEELLMIKKMGANLMRMHVHAESNIAEGINDPRYAEFADQMGITFMWSTAGWTRTAEPWHVDFVGYPLYMKQVFNHPSIVVWEAANHPNAFKEHDLTESNDYIKKIYNTISSVDRSRLISPTTFWGHLHYGNYDGTIDYKGNSITPVSELMAEQVTRGGQDAYTGYGNDWTGIRNLPNKWAASCLKSNEKAYFNFEHEESIGQPNWELCKGKPWYLLMSYEWGYDEGSIGRKLTTGEWKASQAWQAFSAWESMKKQILAGYDGFSWCCLHGGSNMGTYQKPLLDNDRHPKLAYYINKMVFQKTWAGSNNVDVVYGPNDKIYPVISNLGGGKKVDLEIELKSIDGKTIDRKLFKDIVLEEGHSFTRPDGFRFKNVKDGIYVINYNLYNK